DAVEALKFGLGTLEPEDRFGLITYSSTVMTWGEGLSRATPETVGNAREFTEDLRAAGGTNIEEALIEAAALSEQQVAGADGNGNGNGNGHTVSSNRPLYIVFLTDGRPTAGNSETDDLIDLSNRIMVGSTRLFTWGVGYDVNTYLLDQLARSHNGISTYVEPFNNLESIVSAFFERISSPVLADLELGIDGGDVYDMFPGTLPDLFRGSEITVMGRYRRSGTARIDLRGMRDQNRSRIGRSFRFQPVEEEADFLAPLWAQRKVGYLLEQIRLNGESEELRSEVTALGEKFGLVTPYTSYLVTEPEYDMRRFASDIPGYADRGLQNVHFRSATPVPGTGTIRGRVTDADTGNPAAAVNIFLLLTDDTPTTMGAFTNPDGEYVIINVPPGRYNVRVTMVGYETVSYDDQQVVADTNSIRDISLNPTTLNTGEVVTMTHDRNMIQRDVAATQQSYRIEEMERMAVSSTAQILNLQTNTITLRPDSTFYTSQAGSRTQVGRGAVRSSVSERDYQTSTTLIGSEGLGIRRVDRKTFRLNEERDVWRDEALEEDAELTEVEIGSEEFMDLWEKFESLPDYAALGEIVEVLLGDRGYRIMVPESP
ncbi:carboxypeptidase regulatory-like domain-containing protein, partial [Gemmatimonadota bacterium]